MKFNMICFNIKLLLYIYCRVMITYGYALHYYAYMLAITLYELPN